MCCSLFNYIMFTRKSWAPSAFWKSSRAKINEKHSSERLLTKSESFKSIDHETLHNEQRDFPKPARNASRSSAENEVAFEPFKRPGLNAFQNGNEALVYYDNRKGSTTSQDSISKFSGFADGDGTQQKKSKKFCLRRPNMKSALKDRKNSLNELLTTEEHYIEDLGDIVKGYIAEMNNPNSDIPIPEDLKRFTEKMIFGNIVAIYEWHRNHFLDALKGCLINLSAFGCFLRYKQKFEMYNFYCTNKPQSDHIVTKHFAYFDRIRQKLNHSFDLNDLLIKPVQRITKYELLLREIKKHSTRAGLTQEVSFLEEALNVMKIVCKTANDMMIVRRLLNFEGNITDQGHLLMYDRLVCVELFGASSGYMRRIRKRHELQVFLFEKSIIFSDIVGRRSPFTIYHYRLHMQVNKMILGVLPNDRFVLKWDSTFHEEIDKKSKVVGYVCAGQTPEKSREWLRAIQNILQSQCDFANALQSPIAYQRNVA